MWGRDSATTKDDFAVRLDAILGRCSRLGDFNADRTRFRTRLIKQDFLDYGGDGNREVGTTEDTRWQVSNDSRVA